MISAGECSSDSSSSCYLGFNWGCLHLKWQEIKTFGKRATRPLTRPEKQKHAHTYCGWLEQHWERVLRPWGKGRKRQKKQHLFDSIDVLLCRSLVGFNHIKRVCYRRVVNAPIYFSACNIDSTPSSQQQPSLSRSQSVAYINVHLCIYITLPRHLFSPAVLEQ